MALDLARLISNLIRNGIVSEVDVAAERCRVTSGELTTNWIPWISLRAGTTRTWSAPSEGEQVILLSPEGDTANAVALLGLNSDAYPAPAHKADLHVVQHGDGGTLSYNETLHRYEINLPPGSKVAVIATGGIETTGSVAAAGNVSAGTGASGSFTTATGQTVMVSDGVITNIF